MPKEAASSTPKPAGRSTQKSMIARGSGPESLEPGGVGGPTTTERAQEMRAALRVRQEAEALLAEASQLRQRAAADADTMVADAEHLVAELVEEARTRSDQVVGEAQERADGILARARAEADEVHDNLEAERARIRAEVEAAVQAEVDAERARVGTALSDVRDALTGLVPMLGGAGTTIVGVLGTIDGLGEAPGPAPAPHTEPAEIPAGPAQVAVPEPPGPDEPDAAPDAEADGAAPSDGEDARPLGWLFRNGQG